MARYKLHCIGASGNSYKLALYMNCAGLDWEPVGVDFAGGRTRDPDWRAGTNAMGEVPVLEVDGQYMSQSGAILIWLAETTGNFAPGADQRYEALRWIMFDNHKFTNNHAMHRFQRSFMPEPVHPAILTFLRARTEASFAVAEKHLADRAFMLGDKPTIVDFSLAGYVYYPREETGFDIAADFPALHAWRERLAALEAALRHDAGGVGSADLDAATGVGPRHPTRSDRPFDGRSPQTSGMRDHKRTCFRLRPRTTSRSG